MCDGAINNDVGSGCSGQLNRGSRCGIGGATVHSLIDVGGGGNISSITEKRGGRGIDVRSGEGDTGSIADGADGEGGVGGGLEGEEVDCHTKNTSDKKRVGIISSNINRNKVNYLTMIHIKMRISGALWMPIHVIFQFLLRQLLLLLKYGFQVQKHLLFLV